MDMMYSSAKPGGHLGIVEHRGNPMVKQDPKARSGYVNEGYTIKLAEDAGWQFVASGDANNNLWMIKITKDESGAYRQLFVTLVKKDSQI